MIRSVVNRVEKPNDVDILDLICQGYDIMAIADEGYGLVPIDWFKYMHPDVMYVYDDDTVVVFYL